MNCWSPHTGGRKDLPKFRLMSQRIYSVGGWFHWKGFWCLRTIFEAQFLVYCQKSGFPLKLFGVQGCVSFWLKRRQNLSYLDWRPIKASSCKQIIKGQFVRALPRSCCTNSYTYSVPIILNINSGLSCTYHLIFCWNYVNVTGPYYLQKMQLLIDEDSSCISDTPRGEIISNT